jgi:hypothetical protein
LAVIKKLTAIGDDLALVIEKPILELLKICPDTPLEVTTDGKGLSVRPVEPEPDPRARVLETAERVMDVHAETLRKLAR